MKSKNYKLLLVVAGILFLPSIFYLLLITGKNHFRHLEIYGPKDLDQKGDTIYHTVPSFSFLNQEGKIVTDKDLKGKIYVANFFYATCPSICPKMNDNVKGIAETNKDDSMVKFLSFTVNPEHDSVAVLAEYAKKRNADPKQWSYLTGNKDSIYTLAREGFLVPAATGKAANDFFHSQDLILVDKERRIRGIYDGLDDNDVKKVSEEIKVLELEYKEKTDK